MKDLIWLYKILLLTGWWDQSQFLLSVLRWVRFRMSSRRRWLKKSNVLFVSNSHTNHWNANRAINYSANIVNCNSISLIMNKMNMLITILLTDPIDGEEWVEPSITKWHQLEEVVEVISQNLHWEEREVCHRTVWHQISMFVVLIVKKKEISLEKLTKFWRTVLISVSSHIDAHLFKETMRLSGRLFPSFKLTLNSIAQNSAATSASETNSNSWHELNFKSTSVSNAQKCYWCAKSATKNTKEKTSTTINASKIFTLKNLRIILTT